MDVMEKVRAIQRDVAPMTDEQLASARKALANEIAGAEWAKARGHARSRRGRGRMWLGSGILAGAAAVALAVTAVLPSGSLAPGEGPQETVTPLRLASAVLEQAAEVTLRTEDPVLLPGQYLRVRSTFDWPLLWDDDMPGTWARFNQGDPREADAVILTREVYDLYVPADRSDVWVDVRGATEVMGAVGPGKDQALRDYQEGDLGSRPNRAEYPGGALTTPDDPDGEHTSYVDDRFYLAELPRDPEALRERLIADSGAPEGDEDRWLIESVGKRLESNLVPADLRAALFQVLLLIGDWEVVGQDGALTTIARDYESGGRSMQTRLTIDTERGFVTGRTDLDLSPGQPAFLTSPVVLDEWSTEVTVVDQAP